MGIFKRVLVSINGGNPKRNIIIVVVVVVSI